MNKWGTLSILFLMLIAPKADAKYLQGNEIKPENEIAELLSVSTEKEKGLSYEFKSWTRQFLMNQFEGFAHLRTAMQPQVDQIQSVNLRGAIQAAYLYSLYRLNLPQTFIDQWLGSMEREAFVKSKGAAALEAALLSGGNFEKWIFDHKVQFNGEQEALIKSVGPGRNGNWLVMNAFISQRKGLAAEKVLSKLPVTSVLRPKLALTVALAYAKDDDLANAARVLKTYAEPWVLQTKDAKAVSNYTLQMARFLYQNGTIDGAIEFYSRIPNGSPDFITAREELAWSWLRKGDSEKLRGNLSTLTSSVMSDQFRPESFLVKAISDLKLCYYSEVEKDFNLFLKQNAPWTKKIENGIQSPESATPREMDAYSQYASDALNERKAEIGELEKLLSRSVSAVLPAVGPQKHWVGALRAAQSTMDRGKKLQVEEFRRQWRNDRSTLVEAIRKMRFVKVELLSQMGQADLLTSNTVTTPAAENHEDQVKHELKASADQTYPFDGVVWPDELFKLRAVTNGKCVGQI